MGAMSKEIPSDKFIIKGLSDKRKLKGIVKIGGAKNAVLKIMAASILFKDRLTIKNVPQVEDVFRMIELLEDLGAEVKRVGENTLKISTKGINKTSLNGKIAKRMRASIVLTGPILARFGEVHFSRPGGCTIAERPIGIFLNGFRGMGAKDTRDKKGTYHLKARGGKLKAKSTFFNKPSVTATETFLMTAVLAKGKTILKNVALEPEIESLANFLVKCGAKIKGIGSTTLEINGGGMLQTKGKSYEVIPDRITTGSYLILGALASNNLKIENCQPKHIEALVSSLRFSGVKMRIGKDWIKVLDNSKSKFKPLEIKTHEYPGFATDLQAPMTVFLTQVRGESTIFETIFENRFGYTEELNRMGAKIKTWNPQKISIDGPTKLKKRVLYGPDLRAGLAYIIAGIIAKGDSTIENAYYIDRGYEKIEEKLSSIGVNIKRIK
ncbi:MAG: UDP-N-acetylglucosamine 1-carboxyvinyltransferase [Parcubacteria group bacterium]|jgi:UDP-N-acetylglucosamine 1-carboxyvinyltransferase|nr:UDP-N-acetylglucosamine 1-carboxyvinyltransferase [Parcubacteria group bacterium]|tara:strand:+ start:660 stop:1973 length:1314 start_codon:yes stop_codon:yes gene_type:complete